MTIAPSSDVTHPVVNDMPNDSFASFYLRFQHIADISIVLVLGLPHVPPAPLHAAQPGRMLPVARDEMTTGMIRSSRGHTDVYLFALIQMRSFHQQVPKTNISGPHRKHSEANYDSSSSSAAITTRAFRQTGNRKAPASSCPRGLEAYSSFPYVRQGEVIAPCEQSESDLHMPPER